MRWAVRNPPWEPPITTTRSLSTTPLSTSDTAALCINKHYLIDNSTLHQEMQKSKKLPHAQTQQLEQASCKYQQDQEYSIWCNKQKKQTMMMQQSILIGSWKQLSYVTSHKEIKRQLIVYYAMVSLQYCLSLGHKQYVSAFSIVLVELSHPYFITIYSYIKTSHQSTHTAIS